MIPVVLPTARLTLDQPTELDVDAIAGYCTDPLFERYLTTPWPYLRAHAEHFVQYHVPHGWTTEAELTWAIRRADPDVATALLGVVGWRAETGMVGFWMGAPHRGHGYMSEAVGAVADWLFASGQSNVGWEALVGNEGSARVARNCGFTYTGVGDGVVPARDGSTPTVWTAVLGAADSRDPKPGWPV